MPSVSHSRVDGYLLCRRKEYYGYTLGLQRIDESDSLAYGSAVHKILEIFYTVILEEGGKGKTAVVVKKQKASFAKAQAAAYKAVNELYNAGWSDEDYDRFPPLRRTIGRYLEEWEPFVRKGWRIMAVEKEFLLEYDPETESRFRFVIDLIVEDPKGYWVIVDHKTTYDFYNDDAIALMGQIPKYIGALRGLNYKVSYGIYNQIRTRPLIGTKMLKGQLIEAILAKDELADSNHDEPLAKYKVAELEELAINYYGIKTRTEPDIEQIFQVMEFKPNNVRVVRTFEEQIAVAAEITAREKLPVEVQEKTAYRTANKMVCQHCSFKELCEAQLRGDATKLLIESQFKTKEKRPEIEVSQDA